MSMPPPRQRVGDPEVGDVAKPLTAAQRAHFDSQGWVLLERLLGDRLVAILNALAELFPTPEQYFASESMYPDLRGHQFASVRTIPTGIAALDYLPFSALFRSLAAELIGDDDLRLMRAGYQAKFTGAADFDQVLHRDYGNHTLVVPSPETPGRLLGFFAYFTDVSPGTGPTMVVPTPGTAHLHTAQTHLVAEEWPEVYARQQPVLCPAGSVLVYDYLTFHRGSNLSQPGAHRLTLSFAYASSAPWHGYVCWPFRAEEAGFAEFLVGLSVAQRSLLGFPPPGHAYWTPVTVQGVATRFPGIDMRPYSVP